MTRKDELEARARDYVSLFVMSGAEPAATKNLTWMLQQVEREVLEKAAKHIEGNENTYLVQCEPDGHVVFDNQALAAWARAQQKELG